MICQARLERPRWQTHPYSVLSLAPKFWCWLLEVAKICLILCNSAAQATYSSCGATKSNLPGQPSASSGITCTRRWMDVSFYSTKTLLVFIVAGLRSPVSLLCTMLPAGQGLPITYSWLTSPPPSVCAHKPYNYGQVITGCGLDSFLFIVTAQEDTDHVTHG